jgi:8-oxo-dGTP diphosphatase
MKQKFTYDFPRPAVTVDVLIVTRENNPRVLLIRRKHEPFAGKWAIPGGFVNIDEPLEAAARRELAEETGLRVHKLEQLHTFGDPSRDPRGRTISVVYLAQVNPTKLKPKAADDAADVGWHRLRQPPPLAFDHAIILAFACRRLKELSTTKAQRTQKKPKIED